MRYIMIEYHTNESYIFSEPMRNRTQSQMLKTYEKIIMQMNTAVLGTKITCQTMIHQKNIKRKSKQMGPPMNQYHQDSTGAIQPRKTCKNSRTFFEGVGQPPRALPNAPLLTIDSKSRYAIKSPTKICHHTQDISLCTCPWPQNFYEKATIPFGTPCIGT